MTASVVTVFADNKGTRITTARPMDLAELERVIRKAPPAKSKDGLALLKLATFSGATTERGCLRSDAFVESVTGVAGDYDSEQMSMAEAVERGRSAGIAMLFYTSASHTPERPRWRALAPFATPLRGSTEELKKAHRRWVGVLNAILGGVLKSESFVLSQSYYFGRIEGQPDPEIVRLDGVCIDQMPQPPKPVYPAKTEVQPVTHVDQSAKMYRRTIDLLRAKPDLNDAQLAELLADHPHVLKMRNPKDRDRAISRCIENARNHVAASTTVIPERRPLDWSALAQREPPERDWVLSYWLPAGHITLLAGRAGIGKTLLAQHLATSIVSGREFIAMVPRPRRVLFWAGEDDHDEVWRRQLGINSYFAVEPSQLRDQLILHSYAGSDITLAAPVFGQLQPTPMLAELRAQVSDYGAEVVILDNVARLFGGNENDRHAVTTFLAWLQGAIAPAAGLLLSHPAKASLSEYSGSTAWEGSVRTRLYLSDQRPGTAQGKEPDSDEIVDERVRYLSKRKANYSALDCRRLELKDGVLTPEQQDFVGPEDPITEQEMRITVRTAVEKLAEAQVHGVSSKSSPMYLPKLARDYRLMGRLDRHKFANTMRVMLVDKSLVVREVGKYANRSPRQGICTP